MELHEGWTVVPLLKMMILARVGAMHCYLELGGTTSPGGILPRDASV